MHARWAGPSPTQQSFDFFMKHHKGGFRSTKPCDFNLRTTCSRFRSFQSVSQYSSHGKFAGGGFPIGRHRWGSFLRWLRCLSEHHHLSVPKNRNRRNIAAFSNHKVQNHRFLPQKSSENRQTMAEEIAEKSLVIFFGRAMELAVFQRFQIAAFSNAKITMHARWAGPSSTQQSFDCERALRQPQRRQAMSAPR